MDKKNKIRCIIEIFNKQNSLIVFAIGVLALIIIVTIQINILQFTNAQQQNITRTGIFNNTQTDISGIPDWIITGNWSLIESPSVVLTFNAVIKMAKPDGSEDHEHRIRDLIIPYAPINQSNSTIIYGTTTITMSEGSVTDVPTTITLSQKKISMHFDPRKIGNHFENHSITGSVT
ncbi:MAG: hypothetical protein M3Y25_05640 [Thermoproteota archaeon]|nr:hypothetical protein [Thermoproteota archaeon]